FFGEAWAQLEWEVRMRRLFPEQLTRSSDSAEPFVPIDGSILIADKYRVDRRLGQGGMGIVYAVVHLGLQKRFALKVIKSPAAGGDVFLSRFRSEAEALGRLKHPNIVEVTDSGVDARTGGPPYLVMEYLEGSTLADYCDRVGPLSLDRA